MVGGETSLIFDDPHLNIADLIRPRVGGRRDTRHTRHRHPRPVGDPLGMSVSFMIPLLKRR